MFSLLSLKKEKEKKKKTDFNRQTIKDKCSGDETETGEN